MKKQIIIILQQHIDSDCSAALTEQLHEFLIVSLSLCLLPVQCVASPLASQSCRQTARSCQGGTSTSPAWQWAPPCPTWSGCWEPKTWLPRTTCPSAATFWSWRTYASPTITRVSPCRRSAWLRWWRRLLWKVGKGAKGWGWEGLVSVHVRLWLKLYSKEQSIFKG